MNSYNLILYYIRTGFITNIAQSVLPLATHSTNREAEIAAHVARAAPHR